MDDWEKENKVKRTDDTERKGETTHLEQALGKRTERAKVQDNIKGGQRLKGAAFVSHVLIVALNAWGAGREIKVTWRQEPH